MVAKFDAVTFGKLIRQWRKARGISQQAFEALYNIERTKLSKIERADYRLQIDLIEELCNIVRVDPRVLWK